MQGKKTCGQQQYSPELKYQPSYIITYEIFNINTAAKILNVINACRILLSVFQIKAFVRHVLTTWGA
jgi:hypothetical protein